jgi:acyl carrier protein phosphodiesterase
MATTIRARIYARGEVSFAKFLFLPSWFAKLLETNFSCFAKIIWMPSWFAKLLELLFLRNPLKLMNSIQSRIEQNRQTIDMIDLSFYLQQHQQILTVLI